MQKQQQSENNLVKSYIRIISITLVLVIMVVIGAKHFASVESIGAQSIHREHNRLLYVLAMVKSQWLSQGKPQRLKLSWENLASGSAKQLKNDKLAGEDNIILMSTFGWPMLKSASAQGCVELWQQLMASNLLDMGVKVNYQTELEICHFATAQSGSISYQVSSGRVIFTGSD
ncbi:MSHA biogenesis protein MshF [Shewanella sp. 10N.286.51.B2]|uniref:MSHA biogenesis protein MshF n=1 Tax=unclassified Shewanella TaxID=196818 RepID=UPI0026E20A3F|nr:MULTISPECIES: MSHA biogenesis protein MshF [unclassified Shewanella]MDO6618714.1 MSHA biogenesis protein MshF [Shewanella sp. 6_MG-2023]MDO6678650.1 MSHA biogenesis protein MshF [Shewanella sp. 4_MG-2023]MDO6775462.1 MSHA biogenesis protein MshF [Shewanella sp. 3_MG-2023]